MANKFSELLHILKNAFIYPYSWMMVLLDSPESILAAWAWDICLFWLPLSISWRLWGGGDLISTWLSCSCCSSPTNCPDICLSMSTDSGLKLPPNQPVLLLKVSSTCNFLHFIPSPPHPPPLAINWFCLLPGVYYFPMHLWFVFVEFNCHFLRNVFPNYPFKVTSQLFSITSPQVIFIIAFIST